LLAYLVMPTEIHVLAALPPEDGPGDVARAVANVVSRWVRGAQGMSGPVFVGRYRAHGISSQEELQHEIRMLAWRPVDSGLCVTPTHYPHSTLRVTLGLKQSMGFDARAVLARFGDSVPAARMAMRSWIARRPNAADMKEWELSHGLSLAVGAVGSSAKMAREVRGAAAALVAAAGPDGIDGALRLLELWVMAKLGLKAESLSEAPGRPGARGRALVACFAVQFELCSAASVARHFKRAKATLSEQMVACRARSADQLILATPFTRILQDVAALST